MTSRATSGRDRELPHYGRYARVARRGPCRRRDRGARPDVARHRCAAAAASSRSSKRSASPADSSRRRWRGNRVSRSALGVVIGVPLGIVLGRALWNEFASALHVVPEPTIPALTIALIAARSDSCSPMSWPRYQAARPRAPRPRSSCAPNSNPRVRSTLDEARRPAAASPDVERRVRHRSHSARPTNALEPKRPTSSRSRPGRCSWRRRRTRPIGAAPRRRCGRSTRPTAADSSTFPNARCSRARLPTNAFGGRRTRHRRADPSRRPGALGSARARPRSADSCAWPIPIAGPATIDPRVIDGAAWAALVFGASETAIALLTSTPGPADTNVLTNRADRGRPRRRRPLRGNRPCADAHDRAPQLRTGGARRDGRVARAARPVGLEGLHALRPAHEGLAHRRLVPRRRRDRLPVPRAGQRARPARRRRAQGSGRTDPRPVGRRGLTARHRTGRRRLPRHQLRRVPLRLRTRPRRRRRVRTIPPIRIAGVDRLLKSLELAGIGPGANVYAELGSTWFLMLRRPLEAAHVLGKLLTALGPERIVWGTDSTWYGSPQPLIDAFRAFRIPGAPPSRARLPPAHRRREGTHPEHERASALRRLRRRAAHRRSGARPDVGVERVGGVAAARSRQPDRDATARKRSLRCRRRRRGRDRSARSRPEGEASERRSPHTARAGSDGIAIVVAAASS